MSLGERISELRKAAELSQYDLSKAMGVSRQAVSKWESDASSPDAQNLIRLAEVLDTDIEYLTTGRRNFGRRPPVVVKSIETVEKIIEKPVVQVVERVVERVVEKEVPVVEYVEKEVIRKVHHTKIVRNPVEMGIVGVIGFAAGLIIGLIL